MIPYAFSQFTNKFDTKLDLNTVCKVLLRCDTNNNEVDKSKQ